MRYTAKDKIEILSEVTKILNEVDTSRSTSAEKVLEILINMKNSTKNNIAKKLSDSRDPSGKFLKEYHRLYIKEGDPVDVYFGAIRQLSKKGVSTNAMNVGSKAYPTTPVWKKYGGISSSTSKSDVITIETGYSVKNASTQVRVLDASLPQLTALINYTIDTIGVSDQIQQSVKMYLNKMKKLQSEEGFVLKRDIMGNSKLGMSQLRKVATDKVKKMIEEFDANSEQMNKTLTQLFKVVSETPKFKSVFISESISGRIMFGSASEAKADAIITWTGDFSVINVHSIPTVTNAILNAFDMPKIKTKSSDTRISKTFQAYFKNVNESIAALDILVEKESELLHRKNMGLVTEGVFSDVWNTLKQQGMVIIEKIVETLGRWIDKAIEIATIGWKEVMDFLGIEIIVEEVNEFASINYGSIG